MNEDVRNRLRALATRASDCEARRLTALARGDTTAAAEYEREILRLYSAHEDIERQAARVA